MHRWIDKEWNEQSMRIPKESGDKYATSDLNGRVFFIIVFTSNTGYPRHASSSVNNLTSVAIIVARRDETTRRKCNIRRLVRFVPRRQLPLMEDISFIRLNVMYDSRGHEEFHIYDNAILISMETRWKILIFPSLFRDINNTCQSMVKHQCSLR